MPSHEAAPPCGAVHSASYVHVEPGARCPVNTVWHASRSFNVIRRHARVARAIVSRQRVAATGSYSPSTLAAPNSGWRPSRLAATLSRHEAASYALLAAAQQGSIASHSPVATLPAKSPRPVGASASPEPSVPLDRVVAPHPATTRVTSTSPMAVVHFMT